MRYQGWHNWDTWNVNLWLTNTESVYLSLRNVLSDYEIFKSLAEEYMFVIGNPDSANLDSVSWPEIYEDFNCE